MTLTSPAPEARWIWTAADDPAPVNRFTWFRKTFDLNEPVKDGRMLFAANSNAQLWINGHVLRRKVARYSEAHITAEVIHAGPYLRRGTNVVTVLHHNWGDIVNFQRTGQKRAALYIEAAWLKTDASWRWHTAPQFARHTEQIIGIAGSAPRIRFPVVLDARAALETDPRGEELDDSAWPAAIELSDLPWTARPEAVETPGQRESHQAPEAVIAAGSLKPLEGIAERPIEISARMKQVELAPDDAARCAAQKLIDGEPWVLKGRKGESHYVLFDFHRPVHGYVFLTAESGTDNLTIDLGYQEIQHRIYDQSVHVREDGWIDTEGVVGVGYADRIVLRRGRQDLELPDERTARWLVLHVHFPADAEVRFDRVGIVKSQYPIAPTGSFVCGDERVQDVVRLAITHAEVTMSDTYVDTPGREDGQWIEDNRPRAMLAATWFGDAQLRRLMIRTLAEGQGEDGDLHPFAPSNFPAYPATYDWSVQWVAMLWDDYLWTGRTDYVRRFWPTLRRYWNNALARVDGEGLWHTGRVAGDIRNSIHPMRDDISSGIVTPWLIERLGWSVTLAEALEERDQAAEWARYRERMLAAFRTYHVVPAENGVPAHVADIYDPEDPNAERGFCQAGQTVAAYARLLDEATARAVLDYAFQAPDGRPPAGVKRWNNPTYGNRVLRALTEFGFGERAVAHLKERYAPYLPGHPRNPTPPALQGPYGGPLPEYWVNREDLGLKDGELCTPQPGDETGSHGWGAVPLLWMHSTVLGVRVLEPGGARIRIAPDPCGLPYIGGHVHTPLGMVWVYCDPQQWLLEVELPAGVEAETTVPEAMRSLPINVTGADGKPVSGAGGSGGRHMLRGPGRFRLVAG